MSGKRVEWEIRVGRESIYVEGSATVQWNISEWDEGYPEVYAIDINGATMSFEDEVTIIERFSDKSERRIDWY